MGVESLEELSSFVEDEDAIDAYVLDEGPALSRHLKDIVDKAFDTERRFVVYVDERHEYSKQQIQKIFTDIDGIHGSRHLHDWLLHKD